MKGILIKWTAVLALAGWVGTAQATPTTYNVELYNLFDGQVAGSGYFTVDTTALPAPGGTYNCELADGCLLEYSFMIGGITVIDSSIDYLSSALNFVLDASGTITDYDLRMKDTNSAQLYLQDKPSTDLQNWEYTPSGFDLGAGCVSEGDNYDCLQTTTAVPESTMLSLFGLALLGLGWSKRKRA